jgi:NADH-quinone oxidoreductase subunit I
MTWARDVWEGFYTVLVGMKITWRHLFVDKVTLHYPEEKWALPPKSRMRLFMKYEDCIGCGQCARACPVDCIYIKTDKRPATAPPIFAADGTPIKLDTKLFDIDMSLCCYCNLCTYPCPTNCIYMTPEYEFASTDITQHLYHFAKPNAKFLTVNPKAKPAAAAAPGAAAPVAATPRPAAAPPAAAPVAAPLAPKPEIPPPSPGDVPKESPRTPPGAPANPAPNIATGTPPSGVTPADVQPDVVPPAPKPTEGS